MNSGQRIKELDVLRGFAILGIFYINIIYFSLPHDALDMPLLYGVSEKINYFSWWFGSQFLEGAMFALLSMLFGASSTILLDESKIQGAQGVIVIERYYRRALWLIAFGLFHAYVLLSPFEILFTYGILGLALFPLRNLNPKLLLALGLSMTLVASISHQMVTVDLDRSGPESNTIQSFSIAKFIEENPTIDHKEMLRGFRQSMLDDMQYEINVYRSDYTTIFMENIESALFQQTENLYKNNFFDAGGMMLIGMVLMKWGVLTGIRSVSFYLVMLFVGYSVALAMRLPIVFDAINYSFPPSVALETSGDRHALARIPLVIGHVGLLVLLCRSRFFYWLVSALSAVGKMALSNYLLQTVFAITFFYGFGLSQFAELERYQISLTAIAFIQVQILYSLLWLKFFQLGPIEWIWRSLVNKKIEYFLSRRPDWLRVRLNN